MAACGLGLIREALEPRGTGVWGFHPNNILVEVVSSFPYLGSLITDNAECTKDIRGRLAKGLDIGAKLKKIWQNHGILYVFLQRSVSWKYLYGLWLCMAVGVGLLIKTTKKESVHSDFGCTLGIRTRFSASALVRYVKGCVVLRPGQYSECSVRSTCKQAAHHLLNAR